MLKRFIGFSSYALLWLLTGISFFSCNQDPVFYMISQEAGPIDPQIKGMPTNIVQVEDNDTVYVTSRFSTIIHQYDGSWTALSQPGGQILDLAATKSHLYALAGDPTHAQIYKYENGSWIPVSNNSGYANIQTIYGAGDCLFAGVRISVNEFAILREDTNGLKLLKSGAKLLLKGAAYDRTSYYLATGGEGIYVLDDSDSLSGPIDGSERSNILGIINVDDTIIVGVSESSLLHGNDVGFIRVEMGVTFTGGLALYEKESLHLLLLGIQGSGASSHGYQELMLDNDGKFMSNNIGLKTPGADPENSSTANLDKYNSSLRRYPVMALFQAPDGILFVATVKNGLWSYRDGWNAEE